MKLAQIVLPKYDNNGRPLFMEHEQLKHDLLKAWGGYTSTEAFGSWLPGADLPPKAEASVVYAIAMERADVTKLRDMAAKLAKQCRQDSVMIVTPCGDVAFIRPEK